MGPVLLFGQIVVIEKVSYDFQADAVLTIFLQILPWVKFDHITGRLVLFKVQNMRCGKYCSFVDDGPCTELFVISSFERVVIFAYDLADAVVGMLKSVFDFLSAISFKYLPFGDTILSR